MKKNLTWHLPIKTASESNSSEHWTTKSKRHKAQKTKIKWKFKIEKPEINLPCDITLTRIAPRSLDAHDNLPSSLKWIADAISENLIPGMNAGFADGDERLAWHYRQEKGKPREYAVKIEFLYD